MIKKAVIYLVAAATLLGCSYFGKDTNQTPPSKPSVKQIVNLSYEPTKFEDNLRTLTMHCHEFIEHSKWANQYGDSCGIIIPGTKETDDRISGTGKDDRYNPILIPKDEGFMSIGHTPGNTPRIIINGSDVIGARSCDSRNCLSSVVEEIRKTDAENGNHLLEKTIGYYAKEVAERYDHGIKL